MRRDCNDKSPFAPISFDEGAIKQQHKPTDAGDPKADSDGLVRKNRPVQS